MNNTITTMVNYTHDGQPVVEERCQAYQAFAKDALEAATASARRQLAVECFHLKMEELKLRRQIESREPNRPWFDWITTGLKSLVTRFRKN